MENYSFIILCIQNTVILSQIYIAEKWNIWKTDI